MGTPKKIPVTVLTGFLGSGKTTLLNRILHEQHGKRIAVIENEFGEVGIDQDIVIHEDEQIVEMNNGCICCTVRGDLVRIIKSLLARKQPPEHILIETTGIANPAPVAQTFLTDPEIGARVSLDAIITLVDTKHLGQHIESSPEVKNQIAFADVIILNKVDLVEQLELQKIEDRVRSINRFATIHRSEQASIPIESIIGIGSFDVNRALNVDPKFLEIEYPFEFGAWYNLSKETHTLSVRPNEDEHNMRLFFLAIETDQSNKETLIQVANVVSILFSAQTIRVSTEGSLASKRTVYQLDIPPTGLDIPITINHSGNHLLFLEHLPEEFSFHINNASGKEIFPVYQHLFRPSHTHDSEVSSVGIEIDGDIDPQRFSDYLNFLVQEFGNDLYRYKGVFSFPHEEKKVILQGVHMLFEVAPSSKWGSEPRKSKIVIIGKNLNRNILTQGFMACRVRT